MQDKEASMASTRYNPLHIYRILDLYARFGKNIQITEMTIPAYSYGEEDEAVQAELIEKALHRIFQPPGNEQSTLLEPCRRICGVRAAVRYDVRRKQILRRIFAL